MSKQSSRDRESLCAYTFDDGRRCTLPQSRDDMGLCYIHRQKYIDRIKRQEAGNEIARFLKADIVTACELSATFTALFSATAQGHIKPKTASTLAYLGQLMLQTQQLAKQEFLEAFEADWSKITVKSINFAVDDDSDDSDSSDPGSGSAEPHSTETGDLASSVSTDESPAAAYDPDSSSDSNDSPSADSTGATRTTSA